jgi:peptide/nickel transport system substrate-binding protein
MRLLRWLLVCLVFQGGAQAATLRVASGFDPQTMDPHALALLYHTRVITQIYDSLVNRDEKFNLEPALALSWQSLNPLTWRFKLRPGVLFHDGSRFTADDAVFSLERALAPPSQRAFQLKGVATIRKVDELTIEIGLSTPDAVLPDKLLFIGMMSRAWALKHNVDKAQDYNGKQETFAVRNANGTGPYRLERYESDVKTVLHAHKQWWGANDPRHRQIDEVQYLTLKSDATRLAALASGEVDIVLDPPYQDIARLQADARLALAQIDDIGQQYLAFDQSRDELTDSNVKGRNPFKDRRVRQAVYQAINIDLIVAKVLRGMAIPTGGMLSTRVDGSPPELDKRLPYDPAAARRLLAEAGYPEGFSVTLDCVNITWREAVCQAVAGMLSQVGIRTALRSTNTSQFFPKLTQGQASFAEFGWTPTVDAWAALNGMLRTWDKGGSGTFNAGRYSNPKLDQLIDDIRTEPDLLKRRARVTVALRLIGEDIALVPLYRRKLTWALRKPIRVNQWPNDTLELRFVRMQ